MSQSSGYEKLSSLEVSGSFCSIPRFTGFFSKLLLLLEFVLGLGVMMPTESVQSSSSVAVSVGQA